jgi:hypothetical protein
MRDAPSCLSKNTGMGIYSGSYSANYAARNDATTFDKYGSSAIIATSGNSAGVFGSVTDFQGKARQPLAQYGFTITSSRG